MKNVETRVYKWLSAIQGVYTVLTALWPLVHIESFFKVTGPKTDIWLVKTVAAILIPLGLCFLLAYRIQRDHWIIILAGITTSVALASIDFYYTGNHTIKWVYALDGVMQTIFLIIWLYVFFNQKKLRQE